MTGRIPGYRWLLLAYSAKAWSSSTSFHFQSSFPRKMIISDVCWSGVKRNIIQNSRRGSSSMCRASTKPLQSDNAATMTSGTQGRAGVKVIYDELFLKHRPPPGHPHPECPARVSTARDELDGVEGVEWATPSSMVSDERMTQVLAAIDRVHRADYLDEIRAICKRGGGAADSDTYVCPDTFEVCVAVSSAWMDAVESAVKGEPAFALSRPPGHHAMAGTAMGFCIVCFAAVAAFHALETLGCKKVAMLDFDVHHGNGIAALVRDDPRIRYCSIHQGGIFPGSGRAEDSGPLGTLKHMPFFSLGEAWDTYEARFEEALPWLKEFEPDVVIVSAGYDALDADELATASLMPDDFGRMGRRLREVFGNSVAFGLEGGYNLQETPKAIRKTLQPFLDARLAEE